MFQFRSIALAALAAVLCLSGDAFAQDQTRFVLKLNNELVASLRSYGSLRSQVPEKYRNKISFIELQYDETNEEEPIELGLPLNVSGENASLGLDEDLIGQVKGQPVRVPVSESSNNFSQIVLKYERPAMPSAMLGGSEDAPFFIRMDNSRVMAGEIAGFNEFSLKCKFGDVTIPMQQVAGIRFHIDNKDSAVVVMSNGDVLTGSPTVPAIELKTDWGQADIEPRFIQSLTTSPNSRFLQESGDFGTRYMLRMGTGVAPSEAPGP